MATVILAWPTKKCAGQGVLISPLPHTLIAHLYPPSSKSLFNPTLKIAAICDRSSPAEFILAYTVTSSVEILKAVFKNQKAQLHFFTAAQASLKIFFKKTKTNPSPYAFVPSGMAGINMGAGIVRESRISASLHLFPASLGLSHTAESPGL